jgi:diamine N-acetyltransferase
MDIQIVSATPEHADEIARLNGAVQRMHAEFHPDVFKDPTDRAEVVAFYRDRIATQDHAILIASVSGQAVGYVWCEVQRRPANPFKHGRETLYVHQIAVAPEYRGKGVGSKLMKAVEGLAREQNISRLALDSWEFNAEAHAFFERLGFSRYNVNMWRDLEY